MWIHSHEMSMKRTSQIYHLVMSAWQLVLLTLDHVVWDSSLAEDKFNFDCSAYLRGPGKFDSFSAILTRETTLVTSCLCSSTSSPFWKGVCFQRKEFALPLGADSFLLGPFSAGNKNNFDRVVFLKMYEFPIDIIFLYISVWLKLCLKKNCWKR